MNLLLLENHEVDARGMARLDGPRAAHVIDVLKAMPGQVLRIGLLDGPYGEGEVQRTARGTVDLQCRFLSTTPERPAVEVLMAMPRPKVMRRLWSQISALGVARITLFNAWKVERMYFDSHVLSPTVYRPLLIEGLQQARDTRLPVVRVFRRFADLVAELAQAPAEPREMRWLADAGEADNAGLEGPASGMPSASRVRVAVGPEGGWTDRERRSWMEVGFKSVSLGPRVLRSDTACIALLAFAQAAAERNTPHA